MRRTKPQPHQHEGGPVLNVAPGSVPNVAGQLMKVMGLQGVVRGKKVITTNPDAAQPCPDDKVNRAFVADMPNQLWVS